jgi:hypothetical protein
MHLAFHHGFQQMSNIVLAVFVIAIAWLGCLAW